MKYAVAALVLTLASAEAANPSRKRTNSRHKSVGARVPSDESYDPFLGMEQRRKLDKMSMSMSMPATEPEPESVGTK